MDDVKEKLIKLLTKIFQFENEDLDFGVYKILNYKKDEISQFIQKDLIEEIGNQLDLISSEEKKSLEKELEQLKKQLQELGIQDYEKNPKYITKKADLKNLQVSENLEKEIYNHIHTFFSRYYDKGDFISKRRYGRTNKYAIPYNGEETLMYWANNDQYYIKTSEFLQKYSFRIPDLKVNIRIVAAEEEKGNIKSDENKYFIVLKDPVYTFEDKELNIYLEYRGLTKNEKKEFKRPNQDKINEYNLGIIIDSLREKSKFEKLLKTDENGKNILEKHLNRYTARNTYDYFIHKDLKGFLDRELDFYIKNEILDLSDLTLLDKDHFQRYILEIKVIKNICSRIIDFLAQIENFQKNLWEKKKFVLSTNYCITLDYIDEKHYPTILRNYRQIDDWKNLFNFDLNNEINRLKSTVDNYSNENLEFEVLRQNPTLLIDTKLFDEIFKIQILSEIDNLDNKITGLLINSDNFHALKLLQEKYAENVKCCYIDPPYNAKSSEILYKNTFKHSSWLSLIENRLNIAKLLLKTDGILVIAIDENEQEKLGLLLEDMFKDYEKVCITIVHNPSGIQGDNFSYTHEFAYFVFPKPGRFIGFETREENIDVRNFRDVTGDDSLRNAGANCFYPIYIKDDEIIGFGDVCDGSFHPGNVNIKRGDGIIEIYPIDPQGVERKWRFARQTVESIKKELFPKYIKRRDIWDIKRIKNRFNFKTVWTDSKYSANNHGTQLLNHIIEPGSFSFPKSVYNVKDCLDATTQDDNHH